MYVIYETFINTSAFNLKLYWFRLFLYILSIPLLFIYFMISKPLNDKMMNLIFFVGRTFLHLDRL